MPLEASRRRLCWKLKRTKFNSYLDTSPEDTEELHLMFGNQLRESNQDSNLHRHLSAILHSVSKKASGEVYQNQLNVQEKVGIFEQDKLDPIQAECNDI